MGSPKLKLNLEKYAKAPPKPINKPTSESGIDIRPYAAAALRGVSGFAPGGWIGAGAGLIGEGLAQTIEDRPDYNYAQMGAQAALGAIPFGARGKALWNFGKGALLGAGGNVITNQAEKGLHVPDVSELESAATSGAIGGLAGMIKLPERIIGKSKTPKARAAEEVTKVVSEIKDTGTKSNIPKITLDKPKPLADVPIEPNQPNIKLDLRTRPKNPLILSEGGPDKGREIMEQILNESKNSKIPTVNIQEPVVPKTSEGQPKSNIISWLNSSKSLAASADLSAPLRQGIFLVGRKAWWQAWRPMIQSLKEGNYDRINNEIINHPKFKAGEADGLVITTPDSISKTEEHFASRIAEKIPLVGKYLIKPSERAYTTFLNKLRIDLYSDLTDKAKRLGAPVDTKMLAQYINSATGRGSMGLRVGSSSNTLEAAAPLLNTVFFSPRFIASRIQLLNPASYVKMDPFTRKEALRDLATLTSVAGTSLGLAKMGGAEVSMDPTDPNFGKIKHGNVRVDVLGGFGQYIRFFSQAVKGLTTEEDGPNTMRFIESKLSPTATLVKELFSQKDYLGKKTNPGKSVINTVAPMITRDIYDLWKEDPQLVPLSGLSFLGLPAQSYGENKKNTKGTPSGIPRIKLPKY